MMLRIYVTSTGRTPIDMSSIVYGVTVLTLCATGDDNSGIALVLTSVPIIECPSCKGS